MWKRNMAFKAKLESKLHSTEMDFWRRSTKISRMDKIWNIVITEKINVQNCIVHFIKKIKQLKWDGHVNRMTDDRLLKKVLEGYLQGRKKRVRPTITWMQGNETKCRTYSEYNCKI